MQLPFVSDSDRYRKSSDAQKSNSAEDDDDGGDDDDEDSISIMHVVSSSDGTLVIALSDCTLLQAYSTNSSDTSSRLRLI